MERDLEEKISSAIIPGRCRREGGRFFCVEHQPRGPRLPERVSVRDFFKSRFPRFYRLVTFLTSTIFEQSIGASRAIRFAFGNNSAAKRIVNVGAGLQTLSAGVITVDLSPFSGVVVVADAAALPFRDASIDMIICISLLEHVPYPERVIAEIQRVLAPGGFVYIVVPFVYPFHSAPEDFSRLTAKGLRRRFSGFETLQAGTDAGPVTALSLQIAYLCALVLSFGIERLYDIFLNVFVLLFAPLRVFDFCLTPFRHTSDAAASVYYFGRKRSH